MNWIAVVMQHSYPLHEIPFFNHYVWGKFCTLFNRALDSSKQYLMIDVCFSCPWHQGWWAFNTLRPTRNRRHFADDIFKCIFVNENVWISINISLKFVPRGPINNIPALVQIMAWRRSGDKPLSEPMMDSLLTHKCVTRPQWVNQRCTYIVTQQIRCCAAILLKWQKNLTTPHAFTKIFHQSWRYRYEEMSKLHNF